MARGKVVLPVQAKDETKRGLQSARRNFRALGDGATQDLNRIGTAVGRQRGHLDRMAGSVQGMVAGFGGMAAAGAIIGGVSRSVQALARDQAEIVRQAERYNAEAGRIAGQARHFRILGNETQDLSDLYETLIERVGELNKGEAMAVEHFRNMGLAAEDFAGLDVTGQVVRIAEALRGMSDETSRATEAYALLGGDAKALLDVVALAPNEFEEFRSAVGEVNPELAAQARIMRELDESWKGFLATLIGSRGVSSTLGGLASILGGGLGPDAILDRALAAHPGAFGRGGGPSANQVATSYDLVHLNRRNINRPGSRIFGSTGLGGPVDEESEIFGLGGPARAATGTTRTAEQVAAWHAAATEGLNTYTDSLESATTAAGQAATATDKAADTLDAFGGGVQALGGTLDSVTNSQVQGTLDQLVALGGEFEALGGPILQLIEQEQQLAEVEQARAVLAQASAQAMASGNTSMAAALSQMQSLLAGARSLSAGGSRGGSRDGFSDEDLDDLPRSVRGPDGRHWGAPIRSGNRVIRRLSADNDDPYSYPALGWISDSYLQELNRTQDFSQDRDKIASVAESGVGGLL